MSTSIKEQLQTLGLSTTTNERSQSNKQPNNQSNKPHHKQINKQSDTQPKTKPKIKQRLPDKTVVKTQKPAWLEQAQYGVELLKAHFPACFKEIKDICPLKVGIKQDLVKYLSTCENIVIGDKACMVNSLAYYVNSPAYHKRVVEGAIRIDLQGQTAGVITAEEAKYSLECRQAKMQKKQVRAKSGNSPSQSGQSQPITKTATTADIKIDIKTEEESSKS